MWPDVWYSAEEIWARQIFGFNTAAQSPNGFHTSCQVAEEGEALTRRIRAQLTWGMCRGFWHLSPFGLRRRHNEDELGREGSAKQAEGRTRKGPLPPTPESWDLGRCSPCRHQLASRTNTWNESTGRHIFHTLSIKTGPDWKQELKNQFRFLGLGYLEN